MKFYYLIGRLSSPMQIAVFFIYNKLFKTPRARVLVWNEDGELLLVRNWAGRQQWGLPGGGVERKEAPIDAAKRELSEELGVEVLVDGLEHVATVRYQYEAWIYSVKISKDSLPATLHNPWEITDMQWAPLDKLPADVSPLVTRVLENYQKQTDVGIIK